MKLSQNTQAILKSFSKINPSIMLKQGNFIMTSAANGTRVAQATIEDEIDSDFGIYDLNQFLSVLNLMGEDADITHDKDVLIIKNNQSTINFDTANPENIIYPKKAIKFPDGLVSFELKSDEYKQIIRISRSMKMDTLCFRNAGDKIVIEGFKKTIDADFKKPIYQLVIGEFIQESPNDSFSFFLNMDNLDILESDYTVHLWGVEKEVNGKTMKNFAGMFEGKQVSYVIVMEENSSHTIGS